MKWWHVGKGQEKWSEDPKAGHNGWRESTTMHGWKIGYRHTEPYTHGTIRTFNVIPKAVGISKQQNVAGLLGRSPC